ERTTPSSDGTANSGVPRNTTRSGRSDPRSDIETAPFEKAADDRRPALAGQRRSRYSSPERSSLMRLALVMLFALCACRTERPEPAAPTKAQAAPLRAEPVLVRGQLTLNGAITLDPCGEA